MRKIVICFILIIFLLVNIVSPISYVFAANIQGIDYTGNADFDMGILKGVNHDEVKEQLQLNKNLVVLPCIWIANAGENTVSKIDARTGKEVARYSTGPSSNPSRTAIDKEGNCWIANRNNGTIVKIAVSGGVDRNSNGIIDTSSDLNGNDKIDANEVLAWGQDEAILFSEAVGSSSVSLPRALAIDQKGRIWVGLFSENRYITLDSDTGKPTGVSINVMSSPYGAVIDKNGCLWSSGRGSNPANRIDKIDTNNDQFINSYDIGVDPYGIAVDKQGIVWAASYGKSALVRFDPLTEEITQYTGDGVNGRGVGVDNDGNIWVAYSGNNWVDKFDSNGKLLLSVNIGEYGGKGPIGVGLDKDGYIWVTCSYSNNTLKIDTSGKLAGVYGVGNAPYTYSDMTGVYFKNSIVPEGTWSVTYDGGNDELSWTEVSWSSEEPANTAISVSVKAANKVEALEEKVFTNIQNGKPIVNVCGRFLTVVVKLSTGNLQSPVLRDLKIVGEDSVLTLAQINSKLTALENMLPNISSPEPIKDALTQVQLDVNNMSLTMEEQQKAFQQRINLIYKYFSNRWYVGTPMLLPKSRVTAVNANGKIYAVGGIISAGVFSDTIEEYSSTTGVWTVTTKMPDGAIVGTAVATVDGKIYLLGGKKGSQHINTVQEYDPVNKVWTKKADMPTARQGAVAAVVSGKIYVIGGCNAYKQFKIVEEYDPVTNQWFTNKNPMLTARDTAGVAVIDNKIFVVGGYNSDNKYLNSMESYDPSTDRWEAKAPMKTSRRALGVCRLNNMLYAIGGNNGADLGNVEMYDPLLNEWQLKNEMTIKRSYLSAVAYEGSIYAIGGISNEVPVNTMEQFIP